MQKALYMYVSFFIDWEEGFVLKGFHSATPEWSFQFSQLKVCL